MKDIILKTYKDKPQAELNTFATIVSQKMTADPQFVTLKVSIDALAAANDAFAAAITNAFRGNEEQTKIKNKCMATVIECLDLLAYQVTGIANGDKNVALAAGYEVREDPKPITSVAMPTNLICKDLGRSGECEVKWECEPRGIVSYGVEFQYEGETTWQLATNCTSKKTVLTGIKPRSYIFVRVFSMGRKELRSEPTTAVGVLVS